MGSTRAGGLSPRETQVLRLAARGAPVRAIAAALDLSPNTVKTHLRRVAEKLGTVRREEALRRAAAADLVVLDVRPAGQSALVAEVLRLAAAAGRLPERHPVRTPPRSTSRTRRTSENGGPLRG